MSALFTTASSRKVTYFESMSLIRDFSLGDVTKVKYIGSGLKIVESHLLTDPLCDAYSCSAIRNVTIYNYSTNTSYIPIVDYKYGTLPKQCSMPEYHCVEESSKIIVATYNCIGWALGISQFLPIFGSGRYSGISAEQAIKNFIIEQKTKYPSNHPSNMLDILDRLDVDNIKTSIIPTNNTVAFYVHTWNDDYEGQYYDIIHGTRYITTLSDGELLNSWTSKYGSNPELFAHDYEYMLNTCDPVMRKKLPIMCYDSIYFVPIKEEACLGKSCELDEL